MRTNGPLRIWTLLLSIAVLGVSGTAGKPHLRPKTNSWTYYDDDNNDDSAPHQPSYDHQTTTYRSQFHPLSQSGVQSASVAPFFSPDWSIQTLTEFIQSVPDNGYLHIGEPGWDSWIGCTYTQHGSNGNCVGCTVPEMKNETFPIFPALLNAIRRGVRVKLLTNDYGTPTCSGQIAPLDYLALNAVDIRTYTTTTFWHAKYMNSNGTRSAISSVNFSKASFMKNREAGLIYAGDGTLQVRKFAENVFLHDWQEGSDYKVEQTYSKSQMNIITDPAFLPVNIPSQPHFEGAYITPKPKFANTPMDLGIFASPDYARPKLLEDLDGATKSFELFIYQITDQNLCQKLLDVHKSGVNVTLLVSKRIYSYSGYETAKKCYEMLSDNNFDPRATPSYYDYSHQKYWVVDGKRLGLSTGNWSPTDYPDDVSGDGTYPPYPDKDWRPVNRDFNIEIANPEIVKVFQDTFNNDYHRGSWW